MRKPQWSPYNTPATHHFLGAMRITHRSDHGHCRGTVIATGQATEVCVENLAFPKPEPLLPPSKSQKPRKPRSARSALAARIIDQLFP